MKKLSKTTNRLTKNILSIMSIIVAFSLFQIKNVNADNGMNNPQIESKIINGRQSESSAWPWMAYIVFTNNDGSKSMCGGTLVASQWVLTAAHCVDDMSSAFVLLDENNLWGWGGESFSASYSIIHPEHDIKTKYADIALLHLDRPSSIKPVSLANEFNFKNEEGGQALAIGWGLVSQEIENEGENILPDRLQEVDLTIQSNSICDSPYLPGNVICLDVLNDEKATCRGDSGGPLLLFDSTSESWKQVGITSFGYKNCSAEGGIDVFTQVDKYRQFIDSTISKSMVEKSSEEILAKCINKFSHYVGKSKGAAFSCGNLETCQDTTGGLLGDITQVLVLQKESRTMLEYFDNTRKQWYQVSFSELGYCE
jgi:secreted trypsin-like serine protease